MMNKLGNLGWLGFLGFLGFVNSQLYYLFFLFFLFFLSFLPQKSKGWVKITSQKEHRAQYKETKKEDWIKTAIYLILSLAAIIIGATFLMPTYFWLWLILVGGCLFLLVRWHARNFAYRCLKCGHEFEISAFTDFISPHGPGKRGGWKYLRCPKCHQSSRATVIRKRGKQWASLCRPLLTALLFLWQEVRSIDLEGFALGTGYFHCISSGSTYHL